MRRKGEFSNETKELARKRAEYRCEQCGKPGSTEIHHIVFLASQAGKEFSLSALSCVENAMCLCKRCHEGIHSVYKEPPTKHVEMVRSRVGVQQRMNI